MAVRPHLGVEGGRDAVAAEGGVPAIDILVFNGLAVARDDRAHAPQVLSGDSVHVLDPKLEMGTRVAVVGELRGDFPVRLEEEERVFRVVDGSIQLDVVFVGLPVLLGGAVWSADLVLHAVHHRIVVHVQQDEGRVGEGGGHAVFAHHLFRHRGGRVGTGRQFQASRAVVYLQFHSVLNRVLSLFESGSIIVQGRVRFQKFNAEYHHEFPLAVVVVP